MAIRVALYHETSYQYDRWVSLAPQLIRLRPAPHSRTPILSYSLKVSPDPHFENWQQDPQGNYICRCVFPEKTNHFRVQVDLVAEMTVINPFDFFVESWAEKLPFEYPEPLKSELAPYLDCTAATGPAFEKYLAEIDRSETHVVHFLVAMNQKLQEHIGYLIRLEPGIQTPEETLAKQSGSCRDSAWLLVQLLRRLGLAARFVSGYLIQLTPDVKSLDGPSGAEHDFTDLHAWTEVFVPGAGWIGLDPTSGLFAGEGHIPLAGTADPVSAAPITGGVDESECEFHFHMEVTRIHEDPRVTKPYSDAEWERVQQVGRRVDDMLAAGDVRLTMGGEPTFVSIDDMDGAEWTVAAVGPTKRRLSEELVRRMRRRIAPQALLHYGQGKWYPGEPLPRWALTCLWRVDGEPIWLDDRWIADTSKNYGFTAADARKFLHRLAERLEVGTRWITAAHEDPWHYLAEERRQPVNIDPRDPKLRTPEERVRLARVVEQGLDRVVGYVLPLKRQWWQARATSRPWLSGPWPVRPERMFLLPGDSPLGLRLPLDSLPWVPAARMQYPIEFDPLAPREPLPPRPGRMAQPEIPSIGSGEEPERRVSPQSIDDNVDASSIIRTALCVEPRDGRICVFMPPVERLEDYLDLLSAIEDTAASLEMPVVIEGYLPPHDPRIQVFKVTPDPGVIEVNVQPAQSWDELVEITETLYEEARLTRLGTEKFDLDGRHTGTGGGNHVVLGGSTPANSPFLRRPDLLRSLIGFWNNHPSLSYLFSSMFIGPTSQAPRIDEGRADALYELEIAFQQVPDPDKAGGWECPPWLVDRLFRHLLVDLTGNTHRAEFCIDKLYSPDSSTGRLGLVEFRAFEMPPHARMSLAQQLLLRALVAVFWEKPYKEPLIHWRTALHDRFLLPYFARDDFQQVLAHLAQGGVELAESWFAAHFEFRFPFIGTFTQNGVEVELRQAIEPWYVLGEEPGAGGTTRYVDSSVERLQVQVRGLVGTRHVITCNGRRVPLHPTGTPGEYVAGVRYRAWQPPSCLHATIPVHTPLVFDLLDTSMQRSLGGCVYHVSHPGGRNYTTFPVNSYEAESRRGARFSRQAHTPGRVTIPPEEHNREFPHTLDLRRR